MKRDVWITVRMLDKNGWIDTSYKEDRDVKVRVGDTYGETDDEDIFYYYDSFDEITWNNAHDFQVIAIEGTDINEFDLTRGE